uniref:Putative secreted protein n=1 Tax=Ixodes ricinus TaxID=34613 RepID=A0A6B0UCP2_IXORI
MKSSTALEFMAALAGTAHSTICLLLLSRTLPLSATLYKLHRLGAISVMMKPSSDVSGAASPTRRRSWRALSFAEQASK